MATKKSYSSWQKLERGKRREQELPDDNFLRFLSLPRKKNVENKGEEEKLLATIKKREGKTVKRQGQGKGGLQTTTKRRGLFACWPEFYRRGWRINPCVYKWAAFPYPSFFRLVGWLVGWSICIWYSPLSSPCNILILHIIADRFSTTTTTTDHTVCPKKIDWLKKNQINSCQVRESNKPNIITYNIKT